MAQKARISTILPVYSIAWPAAPFTPPSAGSALQPYLRIGRTSASPNAIFVADNQPHLRTGILSVVLVYPMRDGLTAEMYDAAACKIAEHFPDGLEMRYQDVCVKVTSAPHIVEGYEDNGYWTIPISISWRCFA